MFPQGARRGSDRPALGPALPSGGVRVGRMDDPRAGTPAHGDIPVRHAGLNLLRQVLAFGLRGRALGGLALEPDLGLGHALEAQLAGAHGREDVDIGNVPLPRVAALAPVATHSALASLTSRIVMRPSAPVPSTSSR